MSEIHIERAHSMGSEELKRRLKGLESKLRDRLGVALQWENETAHFSTQGMRGSLCVADDSVSVRVELGTWMRPLGSTIREGLERSLDRALA